MAEAALFSITSVLIKKLGSPLLNKFGSFFGVEKDLKKLQSMFTAIQAVLKDAEEQRWTNHAIRDWLDKLKDVAYDIEDILDEIETEHLQRSIAIRGSAMNKVRDLFSSSNSVKFTMKMSSNIREVVERLDAIAKERLNFNLSESHVERQNETTTRIQTHSYVHESEVHGRRRDKEKLVKLLINEGDEEEENVSVIPIVGMGGLGKTTLAKLVYNDDKVKSYFDQTMWAFVSENFDPAEIMKAIIESASGEKCDLSQMDPLQSHLQKVLGGKKYLLVLDDVWNEKRDKWLGLKALLNVGARGSKVIVTTRSPIVASIMNMRFTHDLEQLPDDDCWSLFKQWAFPQQDEEAYPNLLHIGEEIVKKCGGVPLAIKALGGLLYNKRSESDWFFVKENEIWKLNDDEILPSLRLSYYHLPSHLKQCFTFCSLFPKGDCFRMDNMIKMWMAECFIVASADGKPMEDIGREYFDELCHRSFIQEEENESNPFRYQKVTAFKLHDLIYDLARDMVRAESTIVKARRIEGVTERTRHLSIVGPSIREPIHSVSFSGAKKLRTFVLCGFRFPMADVPNEIASLKRLRVLDLSRTSIKVLPNSMSKLKHLRYLDLSSTDIEALPTSICTLRNLQTLKLPNLKELPDDMWKMINLRHLEMRHLEIDTYCSLTEMPRWIGRLTNLQTLSIFVVGKDKGRGIDELKSLNLRGGLEIKSLENVLDPSDVENVKLREWQHLSSLVLLWEFVHDNRTAENASSERVINSLQPHSNVKKLDIEGYEGAKFPHWLMKLEVPNLVEFSLINCARCEILPPVWQLHHLEVLEICNMPNLEKWPSKDTGQVFPQIKKLRIERCPKLVTQLPHLPSLESLTLIECNEMLLMSVEACPTITLLKIGGFLEMTSLPKGLFKNKTSLKKLGITKCPKLKSVTEDMQDLAAIENLDIDDCQEVESLMEGICNLTSLKRLVVKRCSQLKSLLDDEEVEGLTFLQGLAIIECQNLISLGEGLQNLHALASLAIFSCPKLAALPESLCKLIALTLLQLDGLPNLASLPEDFGNLTLLEELCIFKCPELSSLPESLRKVTTLEGLIIEECPILERRCARDKGEDWHKIEHVPFININWECILKEALT